MVGRRTVEHFKLATEEGEGWARDWANLLLTAVEALGSIDGNYVLGIREGRTPLST